MVEFPPEEDASDKKPTQSIPISEERKLILYAQQALSLKRRRIKDQPPQGEVIALDFYTARKKSKQGSGLDFLDDQVVSMDHDAFVCMAEEASLNTPPMGP